MLANPILNVPAGTSAILSGATFGFSCTISGPAASWQEQGGSVNILDNTVHLPTSDSQPFGDIVFTADLTSPLRIYYAKSANQAKRLEPPQGDQQIYSLATGGALSIVAAATNLKNTTGTVVSGTPVTALLGGGTGQVQSITLASAGGAAAGNISVTYNGVLVGSLDLALTTPGQIALPPVNPDFVTIVVSTTSGTALPFSITALYA
jgi:hypothetical protein